MKDASESKKYLELAYRYLALRNRSEKEIRDYLSHKKATSEVIEYIVQLLKKQKFLNDEAFVRYWISARARIRPKGKNFLKIELQQKGVDKELIDAILQEENEELPDELTQAKRLIEKRISKFQGKPKQEIYNKIGSFLARRGYGWEIIKKAIDEVLID